MKAIILAFVAITLLGCVKKKSTDSAGERFVYMFSINSDALETERQAIIEIDRTTNTYRVLSQMSYQDEATGVISKTIEEDAGDIVLTGDQITLSKVKTSTCSTNVGQDPAVLTVTAADGSADTETLRYLQVMTGSTESTAFAKSNQREIATRDEFTISTGCVVLGKDFAVFKPE